METPILDSCHRQRALRGLAAMLLVTANAVAINHGGAASFVAGFDSLVEENCAPVDAVEPLGIVPILQNTNFDTNANFWTEVSIGASSWDATENIVGLPGSGSLHVDFVTGATSVSARTQCTHLPRPDTYFLNAWGKSTGTAIAHGDDVTLVWEYRIASFCTGAPTATGRVLLSNTVAWRQPTIPASIVVTGNEWTPSTSLAIYLVVEEGPGIGNQLDAAGGGRLTGWFDGITLFVPRDPIFSNGFD